MGPSAALGRVPAEEGTRGRRLGLVDRAEAGTGTVLGPVEAGIDTVTILAESGIETETVPVLAEEDTETVPGLVGSDIETVPVLAEAGIGAGTVLAETRIGTVPVRVAVDKCAAPVAGRNAAVTEEHSSVVPVAYMNVALGALVLCLEDKQKSSGPEDTSVVVEYSFPQNRFVDRKQLLIFSFI